MLGFNYISRRFPMSYQEKRTITSIITSLIVLTAYCLYAFGRYHSGTVIQGDLRFWAITMLIFVGIGIAATIIIQIIFHILLSMGIAIKKEMKGEPNVEKEIEKTIKLEMVEDERDRLIDLKATRVSDVLAGIGFIAALFSLVLQYSPVVMLNILFITFSVGSILEGFAQLFYYRKGI